MTDVTSVVPTVDSISSQLDLDFNFISRNVRDLSIAAQFNNMDELQELYTMAYTNLKAQLQPDKPLALDPSLVLEAYKTLSGVVMQTVETKRKAAETLMKARSLVEVPHTLVDKHSNDIFEEGGVFDEDVSKASLSSAPGTGLYGNLTKGKSNKEPDQASDPEM